MLNLVAKYLSLLFLVVKSASVLAGQVALPFSSDFDFDPYVVGQQLPDEWSVTDNSIAVTNVNSKSGSQSVFMPSANPENLVSIDFDPSANAVVFVDYYTQLTASVDPVLPLLTTPETTAVIAVRLVTAGFGEWVLLDGDGSGGGVWVPAGELVTVDASGLSLWHRVSLRLDLSANVWDAYVNGVLVGVDLGFAETMSSQDEAFVLYGDTLGPTYLDDFQLTQDNPLFADADFDGMEDAYELSNGLNVALNDRNLDLDGDGITNLEEYVFGLDPQDASDASSDNDLDGYIAKVELEMGTDLGAFNGVIEGQLVVEVWEGVNGKFVSHLTGSSDYPDSPSDQYVASQLDLQQNYDEQYGLRIRGYICPDVTGNYTFRIAGDDAAQLWLSTDTSAENLSAVAYTNYATYYQQWTKYSSQTSGSITLTAGEHYYFEALLKEENGGDHLSVQWTKPGGVTEIVGGSSIKSFALNDIDIDGVPDTIEQAIVDADSNDAIQTIWDVLPSDDSDNDGVINIEEIHLGLSLTNPDTDGDGLPDGFEQAIIDFDPNDAYASHTDVLPNGDFDQDTVTNLQEFQIGSDPTDTDSNGDGISDAFEWAVISASLTDSIISYQDVTLAIHADDIDGDGLTNIDEFNAGLSLALDDTDGDGLDDGWEDREGYSASSNEGQIGAFGDLDNDRLANSTEGNIGASPVIPDDAASIGATGSLTGGTIAITLIGRGSFKITETNQASALDQ